MDSLILSHFNIFLLVFARMGAMIFINPIFARRGTPLMIRTGLALALSILVLPGALSGAAAAAAYTSFELAEAIIRELIAGLIIGCIFQLFFYMLYCAGDLLDTSFGFAMGKIMDPVNGAQAAILGQFVNVFFYLYFFATGSHLLTIKIFTYTFEVIPAGAAAIVSSRILWYVITLFGSVFLMVIKLALPFVAAELILEVSMGVLMKLIPQIHVFVINIQSKMLLGMLLMLLFAHPIGGFFDAYNEALMRELQQAIMMFGA